jgi:hypothetical protein
MPKVVSFGSLHGIGNHLRADLQLHTYILASLNAFAEVSAPTLERIDPGFHGKSVPPHPRQRKLGRPSVVSKVPHFYALPRGNARSAQSQLASDKIVPVGKCIYRNFDRFADNSLNGKLATINRRSQLLNDYSSTTLVLREFRVVHTCRIFHAHAPPS